jgi:hypothetical protein
LLLVLLIIVVSKRIFNVLEDFLLKLVSLLQLLDPLAFFLLEARDLLLDLNAFFIFFVNLSN